MGGKTELAVKAPAAKTGKAATRVRQPECVSSCASPYEQVIHLQRTFGNRAMQRLFKSGFLQAKLRIGQPNDTYEQEADRVADQVMWMPDNTAISDQRSAISDYNASVRMKPG